MDSEVQLYKSIENDIREKIHAGILCPGDKLPSEIEMMELYQASKMTVRKSISNLEEEGLIYSIERVGNYVATPRSDQYVLYFDETKKIKGLDRIEVLSSKVLRSDAIETQDLDLMHGSRVYMIKRIFFSEDTPIAVDKKLVPYHKDQAYTNEEMQNESFASIMSLKLEQYTINHELLIEADHCPEEISMLLSVDRGSPIVHVTQYYYDQTEKLAGFSSTYCLPGYMELHAKSV